MTFPAVPRTIITELFVNDSWTDISDDVYARDGVRISHGRKDETSRPQPSTGRLTLGNTSNDYSPRWPEGAYYGSFGQNTPLRTGVRAAADTFARTVSAGWGTCDTGQVWTVGGAGGVVADSDHNVAAGVGTQSVPAVASYRFGYLGATDVGDIDVRIDVSLAITDITGGDVEPANLMLGGQSTSDYYMVRLVITTAEAVTLALHHSGGTVIAAAVTTPWTHTAPQTLRVRAQIEGDTIRAKVWPATGSEPYGWDVAGTSTLITAMGWIGNRSGVAAGNTNALPVVFSYDNLVVTWPRFAGEIAEIKPRWDTSGTDVYALIVAKDVTRRLGQGASPLVSTLYRGVTSGLTVPVVDYWPCEDGSDAGSLASAAGGAAMTVTGTTDLAEYTGFPSSHPLPVLAAGTWSGTVPAYAETGEIQLRYLLHTPAGAAATLAQLFTSGTVARWEMRYFSGGSLGLSAYTTANVNVLSTGAIAYAIDGQRLRYSLELTQNGADIEWTFSTIHFGAVVGATTSGTVAGQTVSKALSVVIDPDAVLTGTTFGHITVQREVTSLFDLSDEFQAYTGERAGDRIARLCDEEGIAYSQIGDSATTAAMGPQRPITLLAALRECADADLGTLCASRGEVGLTYRTHTTLYNQTAAVVLDYGTGQVAAIEPDDDDLRVRNDVRVTRTDGSTARSVLETGRLSVLPVSEGGIGRYDEEVTLNVDSDTQLPHLAGWLRHLGTVHETRYSVLGVDLANPSVVAAGLENAVLALRVDDRITVVNPKPGQTPGPITQLVRGYTEYLNAFAHTLAFNCAPESPYQVGALDDSTTRLDSDASTLSVGVNSTATTLIVAVADGTLWTTAPAQLPMAITLAGEDMSVTAISGAASPQTFTVTRSVNEIVTSHAAGTPVHVTHPVIPAL